MKRSNEKSRLSVGQRITTSGFEGTVTRLYSDGETEAARMYEVRLPGGHACICGSDMQPIEAV